MKDCQFGVSPVNYSDSDSDSDSDSGPPPHHQRDLPTRTGTQSHSLTPPPRLYILIELFDVILLFLINIHLFCVSIGPEQVAPNTGFQSSSSEIYPEKRDKVRI